MKNSIILPLIFISFLFLGCAPNNVYHKRSKGDWVTKKSYNASDTLVVRNYGLYNSRNEVLLVRNKQPFLVEKDSVLLVFESSLQNLDLDKLKLEFENNIIDSSIYFQYAIKIKHLSDSYLMDLAATSEESLTMIPIIIANNQYQFVSYFTSGGAFGSGGWNAITWLHLILYIFEDQEIIYSRHYRYKSSIVWADSREEILAVPPLAAVKQEHWDELVRLAMKDYIKRLK